MKCRILVVEDSPTQAEALRALLEEHGNEVALARTGEDALAQLTDGRFDLVLSDVMMPGMNGYDLCRAIKRELGSRALPVVLLTSLNDPMDIVRGLESGADNYITKPYDPEHLLARIRHVLDNRRLRRDAKTSMGVTVRFLGADITINSDREQILDLFISSVEDVVRANQALQSRERELAEAHARLERYAQEKSREARLSAERYRALLQNAGDAIFVLDLQGRILEVNQQAADLLGRAPDELVRTSLADLGGDGGREILRETLASISRQEQALLSERQVVDRDGNAVWYEITSSLTSVDGEDLALVIARDITVRKHAEEELRQRERQLSEAQQIARVGSWEYDLADDRVVWSDQGYRTFGLDPADGELVFEEFLERVHPEDRQQVLAANEAALRQHRPISEEYRIVWPDGTERVVHARGGVELGPSGAPRRLMGTVQDITERKEAERAAHEREAADRASRAKSEFLSRMSHELRTPLNAILGFAQLLEMDRLEPEQMESVEQILRGGNHLLNLIDEVLDLSRIEAGRLFLSLEPVSVQDALGDAVTLIRPLATPRKITITVGDPEIPHEYVLADPRRLKQIVLNYLSNAVKYNNQNGSVTVEVSRTGDDRVRIGVRDSGPGIPSDRLARLFVPFERLDADDSEIEGTGLGLALAKGLAEAMGGQVGAESEAGRGSMFWVELPRVENPRVTPPHSEPEPASSAPEPAAGSSHTVLYIEDNPSNLRLVERVLARPQTRLLTAMQGRLGLELAQEHRPDLILLDLNLPDLPGEEVLRRLREHPTLGDIPVVVISADAMPDQLSRLLHAGAREYLTKPIDVRRLLQTVDECLQEES